MTTKIYLLDEITRNQIAAGEVIERPASVLKELLENSVDAGATVVDVELREGGVQYIEVCDNGSGIDRDDLPMAVERHATSKINNVDDLFRVTSLGFRGEALASVASVSRLTLQSKIAAAPAGAVLKANGGQRSEIVSIGCPVGTRVVVEDLFFNVPPRKKYLKRSVTELGHCLTVAQDLALAYPEIKVTLTHNGKKVFATTGSGKASDGMVALYGKAVLQDVIDLRLETITGWAGKPMAHRAGRDRQKFFVNGRAVRSPMLAKAVEDAYKNSMPRGRYPLAILFLALPPESVDVNVHPAKREVKFAYPSDVFALVQQAVRTALAQHDSASFATASLAERQTFVPLRPDPLQGVPNFQIGTLHQARVQTQSMPLGPRRRWSAEQNQVWHSEFPAVPSANDLPPDTPMRSDSIRTPKNPWTPKFQLDHTFIIAESAAGLILIDQHVAHERVLYDRFKKASELRSVPVQPLLTPLVVELSQQEHLALLGQAEILKGYGYEIEHFGNQSLLLRSVPSGLEQVDHGEALKEFAAEVIAKGGSTNIEQLRDDILIMMSCKGAIKAGDPIDLQGAERLIADLLRCDNPYTCPHGRPVVLELNTASLRRMFGR